MHMKPDSLGKDKAESRWGESCVFVGIRFKCSEILMLTELGATRLGHPRGMWKQRGGLWNTSILLRECHGNLTQGLGLKR